MARGSGRVPDNRGGDLGGEERGRKFSFPHGAQTQSNSKQFVILEVLH